MPSNVGWVALAGIAAVALFLALATIAIVVTPSSPSGRRNWLLLIEGQDGPLSTSKAQWCLWTAVIAGSYVAVYAARASVGLSTASMAVPANVLLVLGFSATTMATAKGVTTAYLAGGRLSKGSPDKNPPGGLLTDDAGITDLSKVQLMTWTIIAVGIYVYTLVTTITAILAHKQNLGLPDIDTALMVLMGLSQGGYVAKKLVTVNPPAAARVAAPSDAVTPPAPPLGG